MVAFFITAIREDIPLVTASTHNQHKDFHPPEYGLYLQP